MYLFLGVSTVKLRSRNSRINNMVGHSVRHISMLSSVTENCSE